jgi:hypothetical protein
MAYNWLHAFRFWPEKRTLRVVPSGYGQRATGPSMPLCFHVETFLGGQALTAKVNMSETQLACQLLADRVLE